MSGQYSTISPSIFLHLKVEINITSVEGIWEKALTKREPFGDEDAKHDPYLYDCEVPLPSSVENAPILTGRWGVGKTATFFLRHRRLVEVLEKIDPHLRQMWYLDEGGLDTDTLFYLSQLYENRTSLLKRALQDLWRAEIIRVHASLLDTLYEQYGSPKGMHWSIIRGEGMRERYFKPVWSGLSQVLFAASETTANIAKAVNSLSSAFDIEFEKNVQRCLADIEDEDIQPVAVIEPIETPISVLEGEDVNLSELLIVSLMDLFVKDLKYSPMNNQRMRLEISVPWHRKVDFKMKEPHKTKQPSGSFLWKKEMLRKFINARIENEFSLSRRQLRRRRGDAWEELFSDQIRNTWSRKNEDTFQYFLRHTHHRTRDLIRLARHVVKAQQDVLKDEHGSASIDDVFLGKTHDVVNPSSIRKGVEEATAEAAIDRISEAERRYPQIQEIVESLRGIENPLSISKIKERLTNFQIGSDEALQHLFHCGFVGVEVVPPENDTEAVRLLERIIGEEAIFTFKELNGKQKKRFFLFEYNSSLKVDQIQSTFNHNNKLLAVIHPVFTEYLGCRITRDYPIGV